MSATCFSCGHTHLEPIISFGKTPLADALLTEAQLQAPEIFAPLDLVFCPNCTLVQITESVPPEILFCRDYPYFSSVSKALLNHFAASAEFLIDSRSLNSNSLVIEAASNDGYLLKNFMVKGIPVLGIDPAEGPAQVAQAAGSAVHCAWRRKFTGDYQRHSGFIQIRGRGTQTRHRRIFAARHDHRSNLPVSAAGPVKRAIAGSIDHTRCAQSVVGSSRSIAAGSHKSDQQCD
ncbi:hypothetical protein JVX88_33460 [Leptolyngbya sp. 7M]|nr:hypothetical protein JVX88_33460 [Leptolyngbya sp. 7M]